jgi:hypothetical protein
MPPSLNLTPERGPSVWAQMDRQSQLDRFWLAMIVGGGVLAASSVRRPSSGRAWAATLGMACMTTGLLCHSGSRRLSAVLERLWFSEPVDDAIDRASADSFPASDAPASISAMGTSR